ncbi:glycosyltransferase family protein [Shewanella gaetbuli]
MKNVLMLIRTTSLAYDDRVRKEAVTLSKENNVKVNICAFENEDVPFSINNVNILRREMKLRRYFKSNRLVVVKLFEMYYRFLTCVRKIKPELIWLHNFESVGLIPFFVFINLFRRKKIRVLWDQHELPPSFFYKNIIGKVIYKIMISMADENVMATKSRIEYLKKQCNIDIDIHNVENLPDSAFVNHQSSKLHKNVIDWLDGSDFCLCQGGYSEVRAFKEVVAAFVKVQKKVIFVGPKNEYLISSILSSECAEKIEKYCLFLNAVPQIELTDFIDNSVASVIFYKKSNLNNWLCAPNRFYQSLARGKPVITGNNPLFVDAVARTSLGVVAETDGGSSEEIAKSLVLFFDNYKECKVESEFQWESQKQLLVGLVNI